LTFKSVAKNAGWLGLIQGLNYAVPLLTVPVVARALGPNVYGILATFYAYAAYAGILTVYGFSVTGPRAIAGIHDEESAKLSKIVSAIIASQAILGALGVVASITLLTVIPYGSEFRLIAVVALLHTFVGSLLPQWVFIGMQRTRSVALIQLAVQTIAATAILLLVRSPDDLLLLVTLRCAAAIVVLVLSFAELARCDVRWCRPTVHELASVVRQASRMFFSALSVNLYTTTTVLIVAFVLGSEATGAFALANRIRTAAGGIIGPISQAVYPFLCRIAGREETHQEARTRRIFLRTIIAISAVVSITLFALASTIVWLAGGLGFQEAAPVLRTFAFLPLVAALSNTLGRQTLLPLHMDREYTRVVTLASLFGVAGVVVLVYAAGLRGAALGVLGAEIYTAVAFATVVGRRTNLLSLFFKPS
jgi:PST family polysaccharide transporter